MKQWIIGAAALLAVAAPGVAAAQNHTGYVGAVYGNSDSDAPGGDSDSYGVSGAVFINAHDEIGVEVDASVIDGDDFDTSGALAVHAFKRTDRYLFGGFVAVAGSDEATSWQVGVEAAKYIDRATVGVAVAYADSDFDVDAVGVQVTGDYFVTDNARVGAHVGYADVNGAGHGAAYGVSGEYQLATFPVSFGLAYTRFDPNNGFDADVISVTARYNFGGQTLFDRDRSGASQADRVFLGQFLSSGY